MKFSRFAFCFCCLFVWFVSKGQYSNKGKDFWISYPLHIDGVNSAMGIYITSDVAATGTIKVGSQTISFSVAPNSVVRKFIGPNASGDAPLTAVYNTQTQGTLVGGGIHVESDNPVAVYAHIIRTSRSGASLILPTTVWGNRYIVPSYGNRGLQSGQQYGFGTITVIAAEANTTIEIKSPVPTRNGTAANTPIQVTLANPGDVYQVQFLQSADISGTTIQSVSGTGGACKKIAVFSSTSWSAFGCNNASSGDNLYQQLFPAASWGKKFLTSPGKGTQSDIFRVFVSDPTAVVTKTENGVTSQLTGLVGNSFYEYTTTSPTYIESDKPASVVQYFITSQGCQPNNGNVGDPEMVLISPVEQTLNNITVFSAHKNWVPSGQSAIDKCYLNIIIRTNAVTSFKINGASPSGSFVAIPGTAYSYLQEDVTAISSTNPVQTLSSDSSFSAIAYGFGPVESYGYNAGTNIKDFSKQPTFQNLSNRIDSAATCTNSPFKFSVPLSFTPNSLTWDFSAAPNISPNANITPSSITPDSVVTVNGEQVRYYGPGGTYTFSKANTATLRDTIKLYTTSATPDGCGNTDQTYTIPVRVYDQPVADFTISHSGCINDSVKLVDKSSYSGKLVSWLWDFGDNTTITKSSPDSFQKKYTAASTFTIKLKTYTDIGCISAEAVKTVVVSEKPVAKFNVQATACEGSDISFTDASVSSGPPLSKWTWDLADGNALIVNTANTPVKTKYTNWGDKAVRLAVENSIGCKSDTVIQMVQVNPLPEIGFIMPEVCLNDASALFEDTSKMATGTIVSYAWVFNAGTPAITPGPSTATGTGKTPAVKYNKADNYKVSLTATSDKGCVATGTKDFTVNGATPKAGFEMANNAPYCGTKAVQVKNTSTVDFGNVTRLEIYWDAAGQPTVKETDENPHPNKIYAHSYTDPSSPRQYTIRLVAYSGGNSCVNETSKTITLYPQPKAAFTASALQVCSGATVAFTDNSQPGSGTISEWHWDLGKGAVSSTQHPSRMYNDSGAIPVSLYLLNSNGCISDTAGKTIQVFSNPQLTLPDIQNVLEGGVTTLKPVWVYGNNLSYKWSPSTWLNSDTAREPKSTPLNDITYSLVLTAEGGCSVSDEIFIRVLKGPEVPNAFSPNGDGINDVWNIKYLDGYTGATVDVYNRYGQIIYRSVGYSTPWDGTYQGKTLPVGTYYYIINPRNGRQTVTGAVTIIK